MSPEYTQNNITLQFACCQDCSASAEGVCSPAAGENVQDSADHYNMEAQLQGFVQRLHDIGIDSSVASSLSDPATMAALAAATSSATSNPETAAVIDASVARMRALLTDFNNKNGAKYTVFGDGLGFDASAIGALVILVGAAAAAGAPIIGVIAGAIAGAIAGPIQGRTQGAVSFDSGNRTACSVRTCTETALKCIMCRMQFGASSGHMADCCLKKFVHLCTAWEYGLLG